MLTVLLFIGLGAAAVMAWNIAEIIVETQAGRREDHADRWYRDGLDMRDVRRSDGFARF